MSDPFDWTATGWGLKVKKPHQLLRFLNHLALLERNHSYAWRGQSDSTWRFDSTLYRALASSGEVTEARLRDAEITLLSAAREWGLERELGSSATDMHMLAVLQHHGIPTRLIDVTANPMTALWFAVENDGKDGVIFAIDVTESPVCRTSFTPVPKLAHLSSPLSADWDLALKQSTKSKSYFRVVPTLPDERMKAQEGYFLGSAFVGRPRVPGTVGINVAPTDTAPGLVALEKLLATVEPGPGRPKKLPFVAVVIPRHQKERLRETLEGTFNRRRSVLFPDIDGLHTAYARGELRLT